MCIRDRKGELGAGDLELAHKLTDTIKNIDKICALEEDGGYSEAGDWEGRGSYNRGSSYANRGKHYVRGHYSRDGYSNRGRESGYSRHDAKEQMMAQLEDMICLLYTSILTAAALAVLNLIVP